MRISADDLFCCYTKEHRPVADQFSLVGELEEPGLCYEFNTLQVVKHDPSGRLFYAQSSGCSCPTPFEEFFFEVVGEKIAATDYNEITEATWGEFESEAMAFCAGKYDGHIPADEKIAFIQKVRAAMPNGEGKR